MNNWNQNKHIQYPKTLQINKTDEMKQQFQYPQQNDQFQRQVNFTNKEHFLQQNNMPTTQFFNYNQQKQLTIDNHNNNLQNLQGNSIRNTFKNQQTFSYNNLQLNGQQQIQQNQNQQNNQQQNQFYPNYAKNQFIQPLLSQQNNQCHNSQFNQMIYQNKIEGHNNIQFNQRFFQNSPPKVQFNNKNIEFNQKIIPTYQECNQTLKEEEQVQIKNNIVKAQFDLTLLSKQESQEQQFQKIDKLQESNQTIQVETLQQYISNDNSQQKLINNYDQLKEIDQQRKMRVKDTQCNFFSPLYKLEQTDCMTDIIDKMSKELVCNHFPLIRRVRGDGNCLFSCLVFPYLELLHITNQLEKVKDNIFIHDILWNKKIILQQKESKQLINDLFEKILDLSKQCKNLDTFSDSIMNYANKFNGFYDLLIIYVRSLMIEGFYRYSKETPYCNYIEEELKELNKIETFEQEGDFISICFFVEITGIKVKIVNFSDKNPINSMQTIEPKIIKNKQDSLNSKYFISLKYCDGHYDILYSRMMKDIKIHELSLIPNLKFQQLY